MLNKFVAHITSFFMCLWLSGLHHKEFLKNYFDKLLVGSGVLTREEPLDYYGGAFITPRWNMWGFQLISYIRERLNVPLVQLIIQHIIGCREPQLHWECKAIKKVLNDFTMDTFALAHTSQLVVPESTTIVSKLSSD